MIENLTQAQTFTFNKKNRCVVLSFDILYFEINLITEIERLNYEISTKSKINFGNISLILFFTTFFIFNFSFVVLNKF